MSPRPPRTTLSPYTTLSRSLSAASGKTVTVDYATADDTATAPADYTLSVGTVTFAPGQVSRTLTVPIVGDTIDEFDETFFVNLTNPTNATISDNQAVGTIVDNDPTPTLTFANVSVTEGDVGSTPATFTITLSAASGKTVSVDYATADGTATSPADYTGTSGTLTFTPGQVTKTVSVPVVGDTLNEIDETFFVNLTVPVNATISDTQGLGTIQDDDAPPSVSVTDVSVTEGDAGTTNASFVVSLSAASGKTITVDYATADGTATAPADYALTSGTLTFAPGQTSKTVDVAVNGDVLDEPDETFTLNL